MAEQPTQNQAESAGTRPVLPQMQLDELLAELQVRLQAVLATRDRTAALLEAVISPGGNLDLQSVLRQIVEAAVTLTEKYGGRQLDEDDEALLVALSAAAGVAIDNARLYEEACRQEGWLRANAEVTQRLLSGAQTNQVLALVTQRALEISGADLVVLALPEERGKYLVIEHAIGEGAARALGLVLPADRSLSGLVMETGEPKLVADFSGDDRVAEAARKNLGLGPAVVVPLGAPGNVRGVLTAGRAPGRTQLAPAVVDMVVTFAAQAGIALELAEHRRDNERIAVFEDRDRIARDLHDLVIQRLYATGMSLEGTAALLPDSEAASRVGKAVDSLDETIKQIRSAIFALHSRGAADLPGLRSEILDVVAEMTSPLGFAPSLRMAGNLDGHVPAETGEHLLSALREALSNAVRHASATQVEVNIEAGHSLLLTVTDDGQGMAPTTRRSGLANLEERAAKLGGTLQVGRGAGRGTRLAWQVPLPPR